VPLLDPFSSKCPQGSQVLRQTDRGDDLTQICGVFDAHQFQIGFCGRVNTRCAANDANRERQCQAALQTAVLGPAPGAQAFVASVTRGVSMRAGFHCPPVIASCQQNRVHTVHNALVMGGGAVGVCLGKSPGFNHAVSHPLAAEPLESQRLSREDDLSGRQPTI